MTIKWCNPSNPGRGRRGRIRAWLVGSALLVVALAPAVPAWAHSQLISMSPADGSTVAVAPTQVVLVFNENIQDIGDALIVTGPDGARVDDGPPEILDASATEKLQPLTVRGHYAVSYRVVSADGHPVTRTLGFDLSTGAVARTGSNLPLSIVPPPTSGHGGLIAAASALVVLLAGLGGAVVHLRSRRRPS
jgi:copper resistance protein C